jgi:hypothetical protein
MTIHEASRTLLKSPPELWAECSDATSLMRHLDSFGEIRIARLKPETAVAWEGETVSGTVRLEPSGWGTRVILTAEESQTVSYETADLLEAEAKVAPEPQAALEAEPAPEPEAAVEAEPVPEAVATPEPEVVAEPEPEAPLAAAGESPPTPEPPEAEPPTAEPIASGPLAGGPLAPRAGFFARLFGRRRAPSPPRTASGDPTPR